MSCSRYDVVFYELNTEGWFTKFIYGTNQPQVKLYLHVVRTLHTSKCLSVGALYNA